MDTKRITPEMIEAVSEFLAESGYIKDGFDTVEVLRPMAHDLLERALSQEGEPELKAGVKCTNG